MMPKMGKSLAATTPAVVKFGARFLDKGVKLEKPWVRTQEYAPVATGAVAFGMMWTNWQPALAESIWDGSIALFSDHLLGQFFKLLDPPGKSNQEAARRAAEQAARKQLTEGRGQGAGAFSRERAAAGAFEF